jgi:hypothetical protein
LPRKCKKFGPYSQEDLNKAIDSLLHPLFPVHPVIGAVDGLIHGCIEGDVEGSVRKFLCYNFNEFAEGFLKWVKSQSRSQT